MANGSFPRNSGFPFQGGQPMTQTGPPPFNNAWGGIPGGPAMQTMMPMIAGMLGMGMPTQFNPQQSFYDQQLGASFWQHNQLAQSIAANADAQAARQMAVGMHWQMYGEAPTPERQAQFDKLQNVAQMIMPFAATAAPDMMNRMFGSRGSAMVASQAFLQGGQMMLDPYTGGRMRGETAGYMAKEITTQMFGDGAPARNFNVGHAGMFFEAMSRRGLVSSADTSPSAQLDAVAGMSLNDGETTRLAAKLGTDVEGVKARLASIKDMAKQVDAGTKTIAEAVKAIPDMQTFTMHAESQRMIKLLEGQSDIISAGRDIFGYDKTMEQVAQGVDNLTQGGMRNMSKPELAKALRMMQAVATSSGLGMEGLAALNAQGAAVADSLGIDRGAVRNWSNAAAMFGRESGIQGIATGGWGQQSKEQLMLRDQQLRGSAAKSSMAQHMGSVVTLANDGLVRAGSRGAAMAAAIKAGADSFEGRSWSDWKSADIQAVMTESGVDAETWTTQLGGDNAEVISKNGIENVVRNQQMKGADAQGFRDAIRSATGGKDDANGRVLHDLLNMDANQKGSRTGRLNAIKESLRKNNPGMTEAQLTAAATRVHARLDSAANKMTPGGGGVLGLINTYNDRSVNAAANADPDLQIDASMREALAGVGNKDITERLTDMLLEAGEGGKQIDWSDMLKRAGNFIDLTSEAGKEFTKIQEAMANDPEANERVNGKLTPAAQAKRQAMADRMKVIAPKLQKAEDTAGSLAGRAGNAAASASAGAADKASTAAMRASPLAQAGRAAGAAAVAAAAGKGQQDMKVTGVVEIINMKQAMLRLFSSSDDPSSTPGSPSEDIA